MSHQLLGVGEPLPQRGHGQHGFPVPVGHLRHGVSGTGDSRGDRDGDRDGSGDGGWQSLAWDKDEEEAWQGTELNRGLE